MAMREHCLFTPRKSTGECSDLFMAQELASSRFKLLLLTILPTKVPNHLDTTRGTHSGAFFFFFFLSWLFKQANRLSYYREIAHDSYKLVLKILGSAQEHANCSVMKSLNQEKLISEVCSRLQPKPASRSQ